MKYDSLNFHIISCILESKKISSRSIAKKFYNEVFNDNKEENRFFDKKENLINRRLDAMTLNKDKEKGFILKENGLYQIMSELVNLRKIKLSDGTKVSLIFIKDKYGCWELFFQL